MKPPRLAEKLVSILFPDEGVHSPSGDLAEVFGSIYEKNGALRARLWYWSECLRAVPAYLKFSFFRSLSMLKNYLTVAFRSLYKNKLSSMINVLGLAIAISCAMAVYLFLDLQFSMDRFHKNIEKIFLVEHTIENGGKRELWGNSPAPLAPALKQDFPQIEYAVRLSEARGAFKYGDRIFDERITFVDPDFFNMFTFPLLRGEPEALRDESALILSKEMAEKYFGDENPLGKQVSVTFGNAQVETFFVRGVAEEFPKSTSFNVDIFSAFEKQRDLGIDLNDWSQPRGCAFVQLSDPADAKNIAPQLERYVERQNAASQDRSVTAFLLDPMLEAIEKPLEIRGSLIGGFHPATSIIMSVVGILVLSLACFNFVNIAIVSAARRLKEIGLRKVVGGHKRQLVGQFIGESLLVCFIALFAGVMIAEFFVVPGLNNLIGSTQFELEFAANGWLWAYLLLVLTLTGLGAGAYPAFYVSAFQPVKIFRGKQTIDGKKRFTRALLLVQFVFSFLLISIGVVLYQNAEYQKSHDWGYNQEQTLVVSFPNGDAQQRFRNAAEQIPEIIEMAGAVNHVGASTGRTTAKFAEDKHDVVRFEVGAGYFETLGLRLKSGRVFDRNLVTDVEESVIVNETFVEALGWEDAAGKRIESEGKTYHIIGVAEDFHYAGFLFKIEPAVLQLAKEENHLYLAMRVRPGAAAQTDEKLRDLWAAQIPNLPYSGFFQDGVFDAFFRSADRGARMFVFVSAIALVISCMGLFGLVTLSLAKRMKEISVRKVLGASLSQVIALVNKEFFWILLISIIIAAPLSYMAADVMLQFGFKYNKPLTFAPFAQTGLLVLGTAALTVLSQVYRGATANPVDALRNE